MDDITAQVNGRNKEVAEMAKEVIEEADRGSLEERLQTVSHGKW